MNRKSKVEVNGVRCEAMYCSVTVGRKTFEVKLQGRKFTLPEGVEATDEVFCAARMAFTTHVLRLIRDIYLRPILGSFKDVSW